MPGRRFSLAVVLCVVACSSTADVCPPTTPDLRAAVAISGEISKTGFALRLDGRRTLLPEARIFLSAPDSLATAPVDGIDTLTPPSPGGYRGARPQFQFRVELPPPGEVVAWHLDIVEMNEAGSGKSFYQHRGQGAPTNLEWDGMGTAGSPVRDGGLYIAQLTVIGDFSEGAAASRRFPFYIARRSTTSRSAATLPTPAGSKPGERTSKTHTLRGAYFEEKGGKPVANASLVARLAKLASTIPSGSSFRIEVHADGTGDALPSRIATQRQANEVKKLMMKAGFGSDEIVAKGLGSSKPLASPDTIIGRAKNKRIAVTVSSPAAAQASVPETPNAPTSITGIAKRLPLGEDSVSIDGRNVAVQGSRFTTNRFPVDRGGFLIYLEAKDGRVVMLRTDKPLRNYLPDDEKGATSASNASKSKGRKKAGAPKGRKKAGAPKGGKKAGAPKGGKRKPTKNESPRDP